jgi:hypothetical protein
MINQWFFVKKAIRSGRNKKHAKTFLTSTDLNDERLGSQFLERNMLTDYIFRLSQMVRQVIPSNV